MQGKIAYNGPQNGKISKRQYNGQLLRGSEESGSINQAFGTNSASTERNLINTVYFKG